MFLLPLAYSSVQLVQFSHSVVSDSLQPHELQHARPPSPSPTPRVRRNPCPSSRYCHPMISSSVVPFSSCLQSFPASGSFQMSPLFISGGQSVGVSASTSVLPINSQDLFPKAIDGEKMETVTDLTDKASGGDGIPVELFQILEDDAVKVLHSICQQIWKTQQWPQDWKWSVFIPIPKKGNAKE